MPASLKADPAANESAAVKVFPPWHEILSKCSGMLDEDWFLIRVRPDYEDIAQEFIMKQIRGAEIYYPLATGYRIVNRPRVHREVKAVERAAFKGYVYARFPFQKPNWSQLYRYCSAQPVLLFIHDALNELTPVFARDQAVRSVRLEEARGAYNEGLPNPFENNLIGRNVRIPCGPWIGKDGKVKSIEGDIVIVCVKLLGRKIFGSYKFEDIFPDVVWERSV